MSGHDDRTGENTTEPAREIDVERLAREAVVTQRDQHRALLETTLRGVFALCRPRRHTPSLAPSRPRSRPHLVKGDRA